MPSNPSAIEVARAATYSHAPRQSSFDVSNMTARPVYPGVIPFQPEHGDNGNRTDPLTAFLGQSDRRPKLTEAERIGADRYGMAWPMIRATRLHAGDRTSMDAILRRAYSHSRAPACFVPLETPIDPNYLYHGKKGRG